MIKKILDERVHSSLIEEIKHNDNYLVETIKREVESLENKNLLKYCSNGLSQSFHSELSQKSEDCQALTTLISRINRHLEMLEEISSDPGTVDNYLWIYDSASAWEHLFSDLLNISITVSLQSSPKTLLSPLDPSDALSEQELDRRIESLTKIVYTCRLLKGEKDSEVELSKAQDKHTAEVFLVNDILDGTINFARRISSRSYERLERIWMSELRELLAYFEWKSRGADLFDSNTLGHYYKAWDDFKQRIKAFDFKAPPSEFGEAKLYLEERYVTFKNGQYKLKESLRRDSKDGIFHEKSKRVRAEMGKWHHDRYWDNERNWHDSEKYVEEYYENIIPAVMDGDKECAKAVIQAFDYSMKGPLRIINAFEMALVIYFVSTETLKDIPFPGGS